MGLQSGGASCTRAHCAHWIIRPCGFRRNLNELHPESKQGATLNMATTLSILDRFPKFFHCGNLVLFATVKKMCKSIKNWQCYNRVSGGTFFSTHSVFSNNLVLYRLRVSCCVMLSIALKSVSCEFERIGLGMHAYQPLAPSTSMQVSTVSGCSQSMWAEPPITRTSTHWRYEHHKCFLCTIKVP